MMDDRALQTVFGRYGWNWTGKHNGKTGRITGRRSCFLYAGNIDMPAATGI